MIDSETEVQIVRWYRFPIEKKEELIKIANIYNLKVTNGEFKIPFLFHGILSIET